MSGTTLAAAVVVAAVALAGTALLVQRPAVGDPDPTGAPAVTPSMPAVVTFTPIPTASPVTNPAGVWIVTGTMGTPRHDHAAVRLLDGRVLVLGGSSGDGSDLTSAELYDPLKGTWTATGKMIRPGLGFPPTVLHDGTVLVGKANERDAELYDPKSGTWSTTGQMVREYAFVGDTATLLPDGRVLVAGLNGAQLYDPDSGTWTATGKMTTPRYHAAAALLNDGRVLVAGGDVVPDQPSRSAELYDPDTGSWTAITSMRAPIGDPTATILGDGRVLVGGSGHGARFDPEVYDPVTGTWAVLPVTRDIVYGTATLLSDGRVLLIDAAFESVRAELYDPSSGSWATGSPMLRSHGTPAVLLLDGTVLVAGGQDCLDGVCVATGAAELYVPAGVAPPSLPAFPASPPPAIPTPTPRPTPYPPATGPVPPNARRWTVTVVNDSDQRATLFLAEDDGSNTLNELCGSVTPNVVPAETTMEVMFLLPAKNVRGCWLFVNPVPGDLGGFFETSEAPLAGRVWVRSDGEVLWGGS
jgi:hypothetical protein